MVGPFRIKTDLALTLGLLFAISSVVMAVPLSTSMRGLALTYAEHASRMMLHHNLAIHTDFSQDLWPKVFEPIGPMTSNGCFRRGWQYRSLE